MGVQIQGGGGREKTSPTFEPISERSEFLTQQGSIVQLVEQRSQTREVPFRCFAVGHEDRSSEPSLLQSQNTKEAALKEAEPSHCQPTGQVGTMQTNRNLNFRFRFLGIYFGVCDRTGERGGLSY